MIFLKFDNYLFLCRVTENVNNNKYLFSKRVFVNSNKFLRWKIYELWLFWISVISDIEVTEFLQNFILSVFSNWQNKDPVDLDTVQTTNPWVRQFN